jgi:hypothetical protein
MQPKERTQYMVMYQLIQKNKVLIYSSYSIFIILGFLSFWRTMTGYALDDVSSLFAPVFYAFLIVLGIILLLKPFYYACLYAIVTGSVMLLSTILVELSGWSWTDEVMFAYTLLVAISGTISLFMISQGKEIVKGLGISIIFSIMFFILLYLTQLFPTLYSKLILLLIAGQGAAFLFSILLLPWITNLLAKPTQLKVSKREKRVSKEGKSSNFLHFMYMLYILSALLSFYFVYQWMSSHAWMMLGALSLFLLAALHNSFRTAFIIMSIVLSIGVILTASLYVSPTDIEKELVIGVILLLGIGLQPLLVRVHTPSKDISSYLLILYCFIAALLPLSVHIFSLVNVEWIIIIILLGYLLIHVLGLIFFPLFKEPLFAGKRRSNRPFSTLSSSSLPEFNREKERIDDSNISIEVRERDLMIHYGDWLRRKEKRILESFSKNND